MGKEVSTFGNAEIEKKIFTAIKENAFRKSRYSEGISVY